MQEGDAELEAIGSLVPEEGFGLGYAEGGIDRVNGPFAIGVRTGSIASGGSQGTFGLLAIG